jgi:AraC family transcriptional regulator, arabinose operon regulatory protein
MLKTETPYPRVLQLMTGHFNQGSGYFAWRSRGTSDWLLIYTVAGKGRLGYRRRSHDAYFGNRIDGEIIAPAGDIVLLKPGTLHDYGVEQSLKHWELLWTHFHPRPHWLELMKWPESSPGLMRLTLQNTESRRKIVSRFRDVHRLATGALRRRDVFAMNALEELLLWCDAENPSSEQSQLDERIRETMEYMCRNLAEKINLNRLAQISRLSVSRLAHLFRDQTGTTPQQFMELQRLNRAKQLLELTHMSIKEIAYEVGFENPFYFTLRFKRLTGLSPRADRGHLKK